MRVVRCGVRMSMTDNASVCHFFARGGPWTGLFWTLLGSLDLSSSKAMDVVWLYNYAEL